MPEDPDDPTIYWEVGNGCGWVIGVATVLLCIVTVLYLIAQLVRVAV